jgi:phosphohistidine phosphatase
MRELILVRHAHAESAASGQSDMQRTLSPAGVAEAEQVGAWLRQGSLLPTRILCSPAQRTQQTLRGLGELSCADQREEASIYDASPGDLMALLDAHRDCERLLLVGHNPGLEQLVALLHSGQSGDYRGMPPAGVAVLEFSEDAVIEPGVARLAHFWWP